MAKEFETCPTCEGTGQEYGETCLQCGGKGIVDEDGMYVTDEEETEE